MKRRIIIYLFILFLFFASGAVYTTVYINNTTVELAHVIKMHQIEDLRQNLVMNVQQVQTDLYTVRTSIGRNLNVIVESVSVLRKNAEDCTSCHHDAAITVKLKKVQELIGHYEAALSNYITASADTERIDILKLNAAEVGNSILKLTEEMSAEAFKKLGNITNSAMVKVKKAQTILYVTILLTLLVGILIAVRLTMTITRPVSILLDAARAIASGEVGYTVSYSDKTEFGELTSVFNRMSLALENGYTNLHNEIIERKKTEAALRQSEERYALAARGANDGLWDWDLVSNRIYFSNRWKAMLGYDDADIGGDTEEWLKLVHPLDRKHLEARISAHIDGNSSHLECEYRILHKDNTYRWMLSRGLAVRNITGKAYRMSGSQTDITERKVAEEQLLYDALHDALTGLPNRALFMDRLQHRHQQLLKSTQRLPLYIFAVLFVDLDRFKIINDSLGHMVGDKLLVSVSQRLAQAVRPEDTVARLGGDEFAIILEDIKDRVHAEQITERIQKDLSLPFEIDGREIFTTASIGIALGSLDYAKAEDIVRDADIAMYQAKTRGKAHHEVFETGMFTSALARMHLENDLRRALDHNEFVIHYQPIIELSANRLVGFEALVRWNHPQRGLIYPTEFIPLAEETGLIFPLGEWVLHEACRQIYEWQSQYQLDTALKVSVNISSAQFLKQDLPEKISKILDKNHLDACSLTIEITESMLMADVNSALEILNKLRAIGIHIHIDDFGTGYSSLSYIQRFPVNALKIDQSFVQKMPADSETTEIIKTIISLAKTLKLDLIAEGLESSDQLAKLKDLNCTYGQGFFMSRPMDARAAESYMAKLLPGQNLS